MWASVLLRRGIYGCSVALLAIWHQQKQDPHGALRWILHHQRQLLIGEIGFVVVDVLDPTAGYVVQRRTP